MSKTKKTKKNLKKTSKKITKKAFKKSLKKGLKKTCKKVVKKKKKNTLVKKFKQARKWLKKKNINVENTTFAILIGFSLIFGGLVWGIGQDLNRQEVVKTPENIISPMEKKVTNLVNGHPMEKMAPFIAKQNPEVAKYLVAIGKKESNWGKFSPRKEGRDCFNYWGYRGTYNQTDSGYSCFDSPRQAVKVVGQRIGELLAQNIQTPSEMIVWKCGSSCDGHGDANVQKWIADVDYYYSKL